MVSLQPEEFDHFYFCTRTLGVSIYSQMLLSLALTHPLAIYNWSGTGRPEVPLGFLSVVVELESSVYVAINTNRNTGSSWDFSPGKRQFWISETNMESFWFLETCLVTLATSGCPASILATSSDFSPDWLWCPLQLTVLSLPCTHCSRLNEALISSAAVFQKLSGHFFASTLPNSLQTGVRVTRLEPGLTASRRLPEGLVPSRLFPPAPTLAISSAASNCPSFGFGLGLDRMGWRSPAAHPHECHLFTCLFAWLAREVSEFMCGYQSHI